MVGNTSFHHTWNLHDLLNCTVFCSPVAPFLSLLLGVLFSPAVGCALLLFLGSGVPSLAVFSFESIHACTACARHRRRCPRGHRSRGEALFPRASRQTSLTSSLRSCTEVLLCHRGLLVHDSNLLLAVVCRTSATSDSTSAVVTAFA